MLSPDAARIVPMLTEIREVRQVPGENRRRSFMAPDMDLTVWIDDGGNITGFEVCYDRGKDEHAVRWMRGTGFLHQRVDDGEGRPGRYKSTPILLPDGHLDAQKLARRFREAGRAIDRDIVEFVERLLLQYPAGG